MKKKRKVSAKVIARLRALRQKYGLGEFKGTKKVKRARKTRSVVRMARRSKRSSRGSGFGLGRLGKGIFTPKGILASALLGAGAATLVGNALGEDKFPYQGPVVGFVVGGVGGAAGAFARDMIKNVLGGTSQASGTRSF